MKRFFMVGWISFLASPVFAHGHGHHPMAGCGLGYLLLGHDNHSKVGQVLAATTNNTYGFQTFGISSGTSGCTEDGAVKLVKAAEVYAEVNFDSLRREMAIGQGEFVSTFAALLTPDSTRRPALVALFKSEYTTFFPSIHTTPDEMLATLKTKLAEYPEFES